MLCHLPQHFEITTPINSGINHLLSETMALKHHKSRRSLGEEMRYKQHGHKGFKTAKNKQISNLQSIDQGCCDTSTNVLWRKLNKTLMTIVAAYGLRCLNIINYLEINDSSQTPSKSWLT
ncbi:hypothetical protein NE237_027656 [Protea cynaroides]|uniref:Uncharacterized protein n=1 Tax=Protea cynaroides TaxID=273540 RepID=A0A9Q0JS47_9MAGN|nr:hypothetical protein NE237_027656 [Protea cynaroides]